jgi:DNA-binding MarR family transcriptional regulator
MHTIPFNAKRTFLTFLNQTRKLHASFGLTPARFDLLYAIGRPGPDTAFGGPSELQSVIRKKLGVSASVVSRMLDALERRGLVVRERDWPDRRQRVVRFTRRGAEVMREALRIVLRSVRALYARAIGLGTRPHPDRLFEKTLWLESWLELLRHQLCDRATLVYAWGHPDD